MAQKMASSALASPLSAKAAMPPITLVATKAPSAMNTPWPKFSTSIRPKTRVRPEAMMKMIKPMAKPATVSVSQVLPLPTAGRATSTTAASRAKGFQSKLAFGIAAGAEARAVELTGLASVLRSPE